MQGPTGESGHPGNAGPIGAAVRLDTEALH